MPHHRTGSLLLLAIGDSSRFFEAAGAPSGHVGPALRSPLLRGAPAQLRSGRGGSHEGKEEASSGHAYGLVRIAAAKASQFACGGTARAGSRVREAAPSPALVSNYVVLGVIIWAVWKPNHSQ